MRELLDTLTIVESRGIYARSPNDPPFTAVAGNEFGGNVGDPYQFQDIKSYPAVGAYNTPEELQKKVSTVEKLVGRKIIWFNQPNKSHRGFGLAQLIDKKGIPVFFGKYFNVIEPSMMRKWSNDELPGLHPELKASKKARAGLKPQDILGGSDTFSSGNELLKAISQSTTISDSIKNGLLMIGDKQLPIFIGESENLEAIRDNLGELIQSLVLTQGMIGSNADLARKEILNNTPWEKLSIHFPSGKTYGLVDFYLRSGNFSLGVSSKGNKGAPASVRNLLEGIKNAAAAGQDLEKGFPKAAKIISNIVKSSQIDGPLNLAVEFKIISDTQAQSVKDMINAHLTNNPPTWTDKWTVRYKAGKAPGWNYGYWVLSAIAAEVANLINNDKDIGEGFLAFLNYASMIQMYTNATKDKSNVKITNFNVIYPPNFEGKIIIKAGKSYYASGITQKYVFDFTPDKNAKSSEANDTGVMNISSPEKDLTDYEPSRSDLKASGSITPAKKPSRASDEKKFGRTRQR